MNQGLSLLAWRLARGRVRVMLRRLRTWRGAIGIGGTALFMLAFAGLQLWRATTPGMRGPPPDLSTLHSVLPAMLMVFTLITAVSERGLYFAPAEVGFLFPAPVTRRELLLFNLSTRLGIQVLSALWVAIFSAGYAPIPAAGLLAVVLGFVFMYVGAQAMSLGATATEAWLHPVVRGALRVAAIAAVLATVGSAAMTIAPGATALRFRAILASPVVQWLSIPARPFAELYLATGPAAVLLWLALSLGMIALAVGLALSFDVAFTERSLVVGRRAQQRLSRVLSTRGDAEGVKRSSLRPRAPRGWLPGRPGALAWRQATELLRTPRALVAPLVFGGVWIVAMFGGIRAANGDAGAVDASVLTSALLMPVIFGNPLPFDFRRDLDRIAYLRSLPLRPLGVALGQVYTSALCFACFEVLVLLGAAAVTGAIRGQWIVVATVVIVPTAWATAALENLVYLLLPYRVGPDGRAGVQFLGKALLLMVLKLLTLGLMAGLGAGAWWVLLLWSVPQGLAVAGAALVMSLPLLPVTWLVGRAYWRFDFSQDAVG